ncbi:hypothetical protein TRVL_02648 [Trypanosoma vivax]|nr:hypothetical protein TRVL_02648 [Trypanosoma vivax]
MYISLRCLNVLSQSPLRPPANVAVFPVSSTKKDKQSHTPSLALSVSSRNAKAACHPLVLSFRRPNHLPVRFVIATSSSIDKHQPPAPLLVHPRRLNPRLPRTAPAPLYQSAPRFLLCPTFSLPFKCSCTGASAFVGCPRGNSIRLCFVGVF